MIIVLDTNILYGPQLSENPFFVALSDLFVRSEDDSLIIPQLVIEETVNLYREALAKIQHTLDQQFRDFHCQNLSCYVRL